MSLEDGTALLKRRIRYQQTLSKDFLVQCAEQHNVEEWNSRYEQYLSEEWEIHFSGIPFSYDAVKNLFSCDGFVARIHFYGEDFTANDTRNKLDLSGFHLQGSYFYNARLNTANFSDAKLTGADFTGAALKDADFSRANLENVKFTAADISKSQFFQANLTNADMTQAIADQVSFKDAQLHGTKFLETKLESADFTLASMNGDTLFHTVQIDDKTNFTSTALEICRIYPLETKKILKQNIPRLNRTNKNVFVAMRFREPDIESALENVIKPVCSNHGLSAKIVEDAVSPKDIPGEIKHMIDDARFVIADLTYRNAGVYFEVGYAYGVGAPVILTCNREWKEAADKRAKELQENKHLDVDSHTRKGEINTSLNKTDCSILIQEGVHFDIKTDRILFWSNEEELREKLEIEIQKQRLW